VPRRDRTRRRGFKPSRHRTVAAIAPKANPTDCSKLVRFEPDGTDEDREVARPNTWRHDEHGHEDNTQSPALHVAGRDDLIRVQGAGANNLKDVSAFATDCHRLQPRGSKKAPTDVVRIGYRDRIGLFKEHALQTAGGHNPRQRVTACLSRFRRGAICHRLRPAATARLQKRSISPDNRRIGLVRSAAS
jgi:hypothetical protein